jgi:hypothetical protein
MIPSKYSTSKQTHFVLLKEKNKNEKKASP